MTTICAAFDNIRLIRRKIRIAEEELDAIPQGTQRDASLIRLSNLTQDLVRALHDFAELGYEEVVAEHLLAGRASVQHVRHH
ncbi:hypothetical protein L0664_13580 [Octadecabacter sp. G9-8]|uniref:Uncharacterized protein n=1 Tax=Octadecabacter dasysiphoniae TaxID=2909341 RepID=A0ABS9D132_9RHOB|nr:hypothetical protein [Octadecabacter dasysiphoniae]MCF2872101.1 hypothetical protein [Octadecabacter dasysiphoniae]